MPTIAALERFVFGKQTATYFVNLAPSRLANPAMAFAS
jgi:hypothetical protein